ncbi:MAG: hypothetical protein PVI40_06640 [Chlamydiota bacterium]|jgi:hypothetical protein
MATQALAYGIERSFYESTISKLRNTHFRYADPAASEKLFFPAKALLTMVQSIDLSKKAAKLFKVNSLFPKISKSLFSQITSTYLISQIFFDAIAAYGEGALSNKSIQTIRLISGGLDFLRATANAICVVASMNFPFIVGYFLFATLQSDLISNDLQVASVSLSYAIAATSMIMHGGFISRLLPAKF